MALHLLDDVLDTFGIDTVPDWAFEMVENSLDTSWNSDRILDAAIQQVGNLDIDTLTDRIIELHNIAKAEQWSSTYQATITTFGKLGNEKTKPILRRLLVELKESFYITAVLNGIGYTKDPSFIPDLEEFIEWRGPCGTITCDNEIIVAKVSISRLEKYKTPVVSTTMPQNTLKRTQPAFTRMIHMKHSRVHANSTLFTLNGQKGGRIQSRGIAIVKRKDKK